MQLYEWDLSSAGRASALQAEGHRFEPCRSHFYFTFFDCGEVAQLARARGSYPRCREFESPSRYDKRFRGIGASFYFSTHKVIMNFSIPSLFRTILYIVHFWKYAIMILSSHFYSIERNAKIDILMFYYFTFERK